jgi:ubiquinone/menaquinone biosynthesis C-methylase UbiE
VDVRLQNGNILCTPYPDNCFDSILEHLQPGEQVKAFGEMQRYLKPGGQVVHGVPVERPFMVFMFKQLGTDIRIQHFSTEADVSRAAGKIFEHVHTEKMGGPFGLFG